MPFTFNKVHLDSDTTAEQLRSARQRKNLKLENVAKKLNINPKYLRALETGNHGKLPDGTYGKNFLREYCLFLGLDYPVMLQLFEQEIAARKQTAGSVFSKQVIKKRYLWAMPRLFRNIIIIFFIAICLFYLNFYLRNISAKPRLEISSPIENLVTEDKVAEVIGTAETDTNIKINGEAVLADSNGRFSKIINLNKGINIITITAQKKYGQTSQIVRQVLVKEKSKINF